MRLSGAFHSRPHIQRPMWYQFTNTDSDGQPVNRDGRFTVPGLDGFAEVTSTGKCNLPEDVGAELVESGFPIEPTDDADGQDGGQDASDGDGEGKDTTDHEKSHSEAHSASE